MTDSNSRLVYSTEKPIPRKEKPADRAPAAPVDPATCRAVVRLDRKGRGGKSVTVVEGLQLPAEESEKLLKRLKTRFGTGGAVKGSALEIQGDHCDAIMAELVKMGYRPKRSGG
jgi:translation initiation factor 1